MTQKGDDQVLRQLEAALRAMPAVQREIFLARRVHGLSFAEIAARTGLSGRRVERHFARALMKIDRALTGMPLRWWHRLF